MIAAPNMNAFIGILPERVLWKRHPGTDSAGLVRSVQVRRMGKGALAPCPPLIFRMPDWMVGTPPNAFASGYFAHPTHLNRHCERSEAIHRATRERNGLLRRLRSSQRH